MSRGCSTHLRDFPPAALTALDTVEVLTGFFLANLDMDMVRSSSNARSADSGVILVGLPLLGLSLMSSPAAARFQRRQMVALLMLAIFMMSVVVWPAWMRATTPNLLASISAKCRSIVLKITSFKS